MIADSHPSELLPWFANGTLDAAEHRQVEAHLSACPQCREEVTAIKSLRTRLKDIESQGRSPGELGLARLKRRIRFETETAGNPSPHRWLMPALAAAVIVIAAQAGLMLNMNAAHRQNMQLMSGPAAGDIQIRFTTDARAEQIAALLQSIHGRIVGGPGAMDVYRIRIKAGASGGKTVQEAIRRLRARHDVVQFVSGDGG